MPSYIQTSLFNGLSSLSLPRNDLKALNRRLSKRRYKLLSQRQTIIQETIQTQFKIVPPPPSLRDHPTVAFPSIPLLPIEPPPPLEMPDLEAWKVEPWNYEPSSLYSKIDDIFGGDVLSEYNIWDSYDGKNNK